MIVIDMINHCHGCMEKKTQNKKCPYCGWVEGTAPESALHLPPGTILQEKYLIGKALGQGGFGITYLAWDMNLNLKLAVKEYLPQELAYRTGGQSEGSIYKKSLADNFNYGLEKFLEEARTLARFNEHPNIVSVRDFFKANGTAYLVMNHIEGVTLKEYLAGRDKPLPFEQALDIFMPVLDALKEVHAAGILHRDISPDNLLINSNGRVVLIDFGAARQAMGDKSRSMSVTMKAGYSPVEQYQSKGKQGPWTDIYAVAATFYHAITGQMPPESLDRISEDSLLYPSIIGVNIDPQKEKALIKAMAVLAKNRYQSVIKFQEALQILSVGQADMQHFVFEVAEGSLLCTEHKEVGDSCALGNLKGTVEEKLLNEKNIPERAVKINSKSRRWVLYILLIILFGVATTFFGNWHLISTSNVELFGKDESSIEVKKNENNTYSNLYEFNIFAMGTSIEIRFSDNGTKLNKQTEEEIINLIGHLEILFNRSDKESDVYRVNEHAGLNPVQVSDEVLDVTKFAVEYAKISKGAFDPSIAPLVDAWGFLYRDFKVPNEAEIENILPFIDYTQIYINENNAAIYLPHEEMSLDFGGIAKGFVIDQVKKHLKSAGIEHALINAGGDIGTIGNRADGGVWRVGVGNPKSPEEIIAIVPMESGSAIFTTGDYERFFEYDGDNYHHVLNPETGFPASGLTSVTVIADTAVEADASSTAVFVLGQEEGLSLIEKRSGVEGVLITSEMELLISSGLEDIVELKQ